MATNRYGLWMATTAMAVMSVTGCATKNWVHTQTAPLIQHTGQLEEKTEANARELQDVNQRAQAGIDQAQGAAATANQSAQSASTAASNATTAANDAVNRADSLDSVVKGLDNYKQMADVSVHFGFDKAVLTADAKDKLDQFASQLTSAKSYILEVTGGTDSTGSKQYNYALSNRRADAVVQYLASKYGVAPHRFYLIGIGKDVEVASNSTASGRKENRRVEVQLLSNMNTGASTDQSAAETTPSGGR
ncbi:MAG TPA: OmpA family protein [Terracidiphilus sp.]|nr:OmpA family protein [Terracidiphilus sp.]